MSGDFAKLQEKLQAKYGDDVWKKLKDKAIDIKELEEVAGGGYLDRYLMSCYISQYYGKPGKVSNIKGHHAQVVALDSYDVNERVEKFCNAVGIQYRLHNNDEADEYLIDGNWRTSLWVANNWGRAMKYFDYKLGLKGGK
ncbi:MAG: hypothetical protein IKO94_03915 [Selenomonadaceae bacterium]|nr:hypothetical protein [Selenomonadaceae bacterium]